MKMCNVGFYNESLFKYLIECLGYYLMTIIAVDTCLLVSKSNMKISIVKSIVCTTRSHAVQPLTTVIL